MTTHDIFMTILTYRSLHEMKRLHDELVAAAAEGRFLIMIACKASGPELQTEPQPAAPET